MPASCLGVTCSSIFIKISQALAVAEDITTCAVWVHSIRPLIRYSTTRDPPTEPLPPTPVHDMSNASLKTTNTTHLWMVWYRAPTPGSLKSWAFLLTLSSDEPASGTAYQVRLYLSVYIPTVLKYISPSSIHRQKATTTLRTPVLPPQV